MPDSVQMLPEHRPGGPLTEAERHELRRGVTGVPNKLQRRALDLLGRLLLVEVVNQALISRSLDEQFMRLVALACEIAEAERGTIFLYDAERDELFSRVKQGSELDEIRIPRQSGIAGAVFASGRPEIVNDAYADRRFNSTVDQHSGFRTRSLLAVPLCKQDGTVIGVFEALNKRSGRFGPPDRTLLEALAAHAVPSLEQSQWIEAQRRDREHSERFLKANATVTLELDLDRLLEKIIQAAAYLLDAERASLFVHDPSSGELWSRATAGGAVEGLRFPGDAGIAGAAFQSGQTINSPRPRDDPRFNASIDTRTGYTTRCLLSTPVIGEDGARVGVLQVLNPRWGCFTRADEKRIEAFATQAAMALQNAQLFANVTKLKAYTDGLLRSLPDGVIQLDARHTVIEMNAAAARLLECDPAQLSGHSATDLWGHANPWLVEALAHAAKTGRVDHRCDVEFVLPAGAVASVNATITSLQRESGVPEGATIVLQDIIGQKKVEAAFSRYVAREFADRALKGDTQAETVCATVLFSDIRHFTSLAESLSPHAAVDMLNEYFAEMAEIVQGSRGVLDKYIGDALMAVFGVGDAGPADADNGAAAAIEMIRRLREVNQRRRSRGAQAIEIGIGLASGEMAAGAVGSPSRMNYTVIGDSVNLASRLEGATKHYSVAVLAAAATVERLTGPQRVRRIDLLRVKGKETPVEIFELLEYHPPAVVAAYDEVLAAYEEGVRRYRMRQWAKALESFSVVLAQLPSDGPSWVYTDRCLHYRDHPPPEHWDGVWTMTTK